MVKENTMKQTEIGRLPEDWEVVRLGDYVALKNGYAFPSVDFTNKGPIVMTPGNFKLGGGLKFNADKIIRFKGSYTKNMQFSNGDLVLVMTDLTPDCNLLGKAGIIDTDEVVLHNQRIGKIECSKNIHSKYLCYYFNSEPFSSRMKNTATGSTVRHTSTPTIKNTILPLPPLPEQEAIAEALSDADAWIESLEQVIAKKRLIKQGAMQELLSPKEDWEVKKLGEVCEVTGAGVDKKNNVDEKPVTLLNYLDVYRRDYIYRKELSHIVTAQSMKIEQCNILKGDILITPSSELADDIGITALAMENMEGVVYSYHLYRIRFRINIDWKFGLYIFKNRFFLNQAEKFAEGSGKRYVIALSKIREFYITFPKSLPEQTRIATILSDMDLELEGLGSQLAKARQVKRGMMQELLTGRVRLV